MHSLSDTLNRPEVDAFLTAVDTVMNSHTMLLKVAADTAITPGNQRQILETFLRSGLFQETMLAADADRDWWILHEVPWWTPDPAPRAAPNKDAPWLVREGFELSLNPLGSPALVARLRWMLCEAFSPYRHHLDAVEAERLVENFLRVVLASPESAETVSGDAVPWLLREWAFVDVRPDFLVSTEYYSGAPDPHLAYFDGGRSDTATYFHCNEVFCLLLTNGSP